MCCCRCQGLMKGFYVYIPSVHHCFIVSFAHLLSSALPPFHSRVSDNYPLKLAEMGGGAN